jgi:pyruvate kinase
MLWPAADAEDVGAVGPLPRREQRIRLRPGDALTLTRDPDGGNPQRPAIPCTLPEAFHAVGVGEPIWFDDGRLGGVVEDVATDEILVRVTHAGPDGTTLRADKGINLPETDLRLPAITPPDEPAIAFAARHADFVGLSFVNSPTDVREVRQLLGEHGAGGIGIVLKVETKRAFAALPELLLAALEESAPVGV